MYEWKCSPYDSAYDRYYLPYFGENSEIFQLTWENSLNEGSYVYPINDNELNCTGLVTALKFCYTTTLPLVNQSPRNAFLFFTLTRTSNAEFEFEVTRSIQVTATPSSTTCTQDDPHQCCEIKEFSLQDRFNITSPNLAVGFGPRQDSQIVRQGLSDGVYPIYTTSSHRSSASLNLGRTYTLNPSGEEALRLAWLHI